MKKIILIFILFCASISMWAQQPNCNGTCDGAKNAANFGDEEAMFCYAMFCAQSPEEALSYTRKSADKNYAPAQCFLGTLYTTEENGLVAVDFYEALKWYRKSAEQGYAEAQFYLANAYVSGIDGVLNPDQEEAMNWLLKSAEGGYYNAQWTLGHFYVEQGDSNSALCWLEKASVIADSNRKNVPKENQAEFDKQFNIAELKDLIKQLKAEGYSCSQSGGSSPIEKATYVRTDIAEKTFDSKGGTQDFHVYSDGKSYSVSVAPDWCRVEQKSGFFTVTCKQNYGAYRDITLTVTADSKTTLVTIKQTEPVATYIRVNSNSVKINALNGKVEIPILTDGYAWSYSGIPSWISASQSGKTLMIAAQDNTGNARSGNIRISSGDYSATITVAQSAPATYIKPGRSHIRFSTEGNSETISVETDGEAWTYAGAPSWISAKKDGKYLILQCYENTGQYGGKRESSFSVKSDNKTATIFVTQSAPFNAPKGDPRIFGISAGYVQKQWKWTENGKTHKIGAFDKENSFVNGIQAGIRIEPLFKRGFGLSTGLFYEYYFSKSDNYTDTYSDSPEEYNYHLNFSEHSLYLPLHLEYRLNFSENFQLFFEAGPSIDYALSGNLTATEAGEKEPYFSETNIYRNADIGFPQKRFNASLDFGAGIRLNGLQLNLGMSRGLLDISSNPDINIKQNKNLTASLSWMLNDEGLEDFMDKDEDGDYREHGLTVGYISKQWNWKNENYVSKSGLWDDSQSVPGFRLGYSYQPQFGYGYGLSTGLNLDTYISVSDDMYDDSGSYYWLFSEMAINVPLHVEYRLHFSENFSLFFETGASIECGLFAEMEAHGDDVEEYTESDLYGKADWGYPSNRFNAYWDFAGGFRIKNFQLSAGASRGLTPVTLEDGWKVTQNHNLSLGLSWFF
jgi:hypothetical protein